MKTFFLVAGMLLLVAAAAAPAAAHDDMQPNNPFDGLDQLEGAADGYLSQFMDVFKHMFGAGGDQPEAKTVAELAEHAPGNVSILINALGRVDLHKIIANPDFQATIFVPTNRAFEAALLKLKLTPAQLYADKTALTNILSYHVIHGSTLAAADLKDGQELTTVSEQKLTVKVDKVAGASIQGATETAKVLAADIRAGKSIIHVIDTVLLPPKPTTEKEV